MPDVTHLAACPSRKPADCVTRCVMHTLTVGIGGRSVYEHEYFVLFVQICLEEVVVCASQNVGIYHCYSY